MIDLSVSLLFSSRMSTLLYSSDGESLYLSFQLFEQLSEMEIFLLWQMRNADLLEIVQQCMPYTSENTRHIWSHVYGLVVKM